MEIPCTVKNTIWNRYIGGKSETAQCFCCTHEIISFDNYYCGYIINKQNGGLVHLDNLLPICKYCNDSLKEMNMVDFMNKYGFIKNANWENISIQSNTSSSSSDYSSFDYSSFDYSSYTCSSSLSNTYSSSDYHSSNSDESIMETYSSDSDKSNIIPFSESSEYQLYNNKGKLELSEDQSNKILTNMPNDWCIICYTNLIDSVIITCGHCIMCYECSKKCNNICPICRKKFDDSQVIKMYK